MSHVFISYKREEAELANVIRAGLRAEGHTVWWDENLQTGQRWESAIDEALMSAYAIVVLWSRMSVESDWVKHEASVAKLRRSLVQAFIDDCAIPLPFTTTMAADLRKWNKREDHPAFGEISREVRRLREGATRRSERDSNAGSRSWQWAGLVAALALSLTVVVLTWGVPALAGTDSLSPICRLASVRLIDNRFYDIQELDTAWQHNVLLRAQQLELDLALRPIRIDEEITTVKQMAEIESFTQLNSTVRATENLDHQVLVRNLLEIYRYTQRHSSYSRVYGELDAALRGSNPLFDAKQVLRANSFSRGAINEAVTQIARNPGDARANSILEKLNRLPPVTFGKKQGVANLGDNSGSPPAEHGHIKWPAYHDEDNLTYQFFLGEGSYFVVDYYGRFPDVDRIAKDMATAFATFDVPILLDVIDYVKDKRTHEYDRYSKYLNLTNQLLCRVLPRVVQGEAVVVNGDRSPVTIVPRCQLSVEGVSVACHADVPLGFDFPDDEKSARQLFVASTQSGRYITAKGDAVVSIAIRGRYVGSDEQWALTKSAFADGSCDCQLTMRTIRDQELSSPLVLMGNKPK